MWPRHLYFFSLILFKNNSAVNPRTYIYLYPYRTLVITRTTITTLTITTVDAANAFIAANAIQIPAITLPLTVIMCVAYD